MNDPVLTLGRLHLLILHLPIGLVAGLAVLRSLPALRTAAVMPALRSLWVIAALSGIAAALTGWVLMLGEGNQWGMNGLLHQWLGSALAATLVLGAILAWCGRSLGSDVVLALCVLLTFATGHLGGTLTHGSNFLWGGGSPMTATAAESNDQAEAEGENNESPSEDDVATADNDDKQLLASNRALWTAAHGVMVQHCMDCHNNNRQRGYLNLETHQAIMRGGSSGPAVVPMDPAKSRMLTLAMLPEDNWDRMPPEGDPLNEDELSALRAWILAGAPDASGKPVQADE